MNPITKASIARKLLHGDRLYLAKVKDLRTEEIDYLVIAENIPLQTEITTGGNPGLSCHRTLKQGCLGRSIFLGDRAVEILEFSPFDFYFVPSRLPSIDWSI